MDYGNKERARSKEQVTQGHNIVADGWAEEEEDKEEEAEEAK